MSPTAKTTLKVIYKISEGRYQIQILSLLSDVLYPTSVLIDENVHKDKTFFALTRLDINNVDDYI